MNKVIRWKLTMTPIGSLVCSLSQRWSRESGSLHWRAEWHRWAGNAYRVVPKGEIEADFVSCNQD